MLQCKFCSEKLPKIIFNNPIFMTKTRQQQAKNRSLVTQTDNMDVWILWMRGDEKCAQASDKVTAAEGVVEVLMTDAT